MNCPNCGFEIRRQNFKGIDLQRCSECQGVWLCAPDMERLEDRDFETKEVQAATLSENQSSELLCPECREQMHRFRYRYYEMMLDFCPEHGYWIDRNEEKRVLQYMRQEAKALMNNLTAEERWADFLIKLRSPMFWSRLNLL